MGIILGEQLGEETDDSHPYQLDALLNRDFEFPTDLDDGIVEVRVRRLKISIAGRPRQRIILEADPGGEINDIYEMVEEYLNQSRIPKSSLNVIGVSFKLSFDHQDNDLPRSLSFDVSHPNSSNLKSKPEKLRQLGEKYLSNWELDRATNCTVGQSVDG